MSTKPRVYFPGTLHQFYEFARPILEPATEVVVFPERVFSADELAEIFRDVDGAILTAFEKVPRSVIEAAPRLRALSKYGVGVETIDLEAATERGIPVTNTPGANSLGVAEHTLALMLALLRHIPSLNRLVRENRWNDARRLIGADVEGSALGLAGIGNVGRLVAERASAMGMRVLAYDPFQTADATTRAGATKVETLDELLAESDVVSLHVAVTKENRRMFGEAAFRRMKPTAYFVNTARAALVDQDALVKALAEGWIAGAALDVFEPEPLPPDSPLLRLDNVIITPHHAGTTVRTRERTLSQAAANLVRMLSDEVPEIGLCNPAVRERLPAR